MRLRPRGTHAQDVAQVLPRCVTGVSTTDKRGTAGATRWLAVEPGILEPVAPLPIRDVCTKPPVRGFGRDQTASPSTRWRPSILGSAVISNILLDVESTAGSEAKRRPLYRALACLAVLAQVALLSHIFRIGVGWDDGEVTGDRSGILYVVSLAQALVILLIAGVVMWKRPLLVLWLPVLSFFLMLGIEMVHYEVLGVFSFVVICALVGLALIRLSKNGPPG